MNPIIMNADNASFDSAIQVKEPIGEKIAATRIAINEDKENQDILSGVWECTPGIWRRQILKSEFSHFVAGECIFTPDGQEPIKIQAGDAIFFPAGCEGTWDIRETVRKTFVIFE